MSIPANSLLSKFQSVQLLLLYRHYQPLKNEMKVFINPFKNTIKIKMIFFPVSLVALSAGSQVSPDYSSDKSSIKNKWPMEQ